MLLHQDTKVKGSGVVTEPLLPNSVKDLQHQGCVIGLVGAGQFTGDGDVVVFDQDFDGHTAILVMLKAVCHNRVGNLITDFVGVTVGNLFTSDNVAHEVTYPFCRAAYRAANQRFHGR